MPLASAPRARLLHALVALAATVLLAAPDGSSGAGAATADGRLTVTTSTAAGRAQSTIFVESSGPIAEVTVFVPQGYDLDVALPEGASVGNLLTFVDDPDGSIELPTIGELVVADPARYASDPAAQACAPGPHAAVWRASLSVPGRELELALFVDRAVPSSPAGSTYSLTACPVWPSSSPGQAHLFAISFGLFLEGVLRAPGAPGRYSWSAYLTPTAAGSLAPDPARSLEARAIVLLPRTLTLQAKHDPRANSVLLTGRLLTMGRPEAGVEVEVSALVPATEDVTFFGSARTNAAGRFSLRRHVERTTEYTASVPGVVGPCSAPSPAPGGCTAETVAPPDAARAAVIVRKRTDARLRPRHADRARARAATLRLGDLPSGWFAAPLLTPIDLCPRFAPNLSSLTATGEAWSALLGAPDLSAAAFSSSAVYATEADARTAFARQAVRAVADCVADDARRSGASILSSGRLAFPRLGAQTRAFRVVASNQDETAALDLVFFRRGRTVVQLGFQSPPGTLDVQRSAALAVAARAGAR
jgi:hypothetical protein